MVLVSSNLTVAATNVLLLGLSFVSADERLKRLVMLKVSVCFLGSLLVY